MGRGMKAGKKPKTSITLKRKDLKTLEKVVQQYEVEERKRLVEFVKEDIAEELTQMLRYRHNIDMIGVMFALHDEFGFGKSRLIRTMKKATDHAERMILDEADVDEMMELLKDETGIREEELVWDVEVEL